MRLISCVVTVKCISACSASSVHPAWMRAVKQVYTGTQTLGWDFQMPRNAIDSETEKTARFLLLPQEVNCNTGKGRLMTHIKWKSMARSVRVGKYVFYSAKTPNQKSKHQTKKPNKRKQSWKLHLAYIYRSHSRRKEIRKQSSQTPNLQVPGPPSAVLLFWL